MGVSCTSAFINRQNLSDLKPHFVWSAFHPENNTSCCSWWCFRPDMVSTVLLGALCGASAVAVVVVVVVCCFLYRRRCSRRGHLSQASGIYEAIGDYKPVSVMSVSSGSQVRTCFVIGGGGGGDSSSSSSFLSFFSFFLFFFKL